MFSPGWPEGTFLICAEGLGGNPSEVTCPLVELWPPVEEEEVRCELWLFSVTPCLIMLEEEVEDEEEEEGGGMFCGW